MQSNRYHTAPQSQDILRQLKGLKYDAYTPRFLPLLFIASYSQVIEKFLLEHQKRSRSADWRVEEEKEAGGREEEGESERSFKSSGDR